MIIYNFKPKIKLELELPNIEESWKSLNNKGATLGIPGFRHMQTGGIVPGAIGQSVPIMAQ